MRALEASVRRGLGVEPVHRMRVQTRRLRGALRLFRDHLPPEGVQAVREPLRALAVALGKERDEDVLAARLRGYMPGAGPAELAVLEALVARRRAVKGRAHAALLARLRSPEHGELCAALEALIASESGSAEPPARRFARKAVRRRFARVRRHARRADPREPESLHALRIAVKNLRYAVDAVGPAYGRRAERVSRQAAKLQDALGQIHDLDVLLERVARARGSGPMWEEGTAVLRERMTAERDALAAKLPRRVERLLRLG